MAAFASMLSSLQRVFDPPIQPSRLIVRHRVRIFAAAGAGAVSAVVFLVGYYLTLGLLPSAFAYPQTEYPVSAWAHRMDLAQFAGSFLYPPLPSPLTWWIGFIVLGGTFTGLGLVYAILLAWSLQTSSAVKGVGFGVALFIGLGLTLTVANGVHPAIMRNAFPDTGLFLVGWSSWATFQLLALHVIYGGLLGTLYQRFTARP
jgi:hypothetical protein